MDITTLGRYQIVAQLGRGAMGTVYRALDPAIERTVAIKTLNPDLPDENMKEVKERFLREAKSAGRLNHPNVVTVYDVGETSTGVAYIAMEYLEGKSLRQVLDTEAPPSVQAVVDIVAQIADALDYAQRYGIVHRDIKPANIMLSPSGLAKLTDFGVAYMPSSSMTQTGTVLGSPKYLSPEQVLGMPVDGRADIFALGTVLFEMLTGKTPFEKPEITVFSLMQAICTNQAPRITEIRRDLPVAFDTILNRALGKRPEERYQRASEFAADLRNYKRFAEVSSEQTMMGRVDTTQIVRPAAPEAPLPHPAAPDHEMEQKLKSLLSDLDTFSTRIDQDQRMLEERARILAEAREKAEAEANQPSPDTTMARKARSALISQLQEQAKARTQQGADKPALEAVMALSAKLRQALDYLTDFVREFNAAAPAFSGKLSMPYAGNLPQVTLGDGFVDYRTTKFQDKEILDNVTLSYAMTSDQKPTVTVNKEEARILKLQLDRAQIKFLEREVKQFFQKVPGVELTIECKVPARVTLRVDHKTQIVDILCQNVAMIGASRFRFPADKFDEDVLDEFGKRMLGLPNRLSELKLPD